MKRFNFLIKENNKRRYANVIAKDIISAIIEAMRQTGILNPEELLYKKNGEYIPVNL